MRNVSISKKIKKVIPIAPVIPGVYEVSLFDHSYNYKIYVYFDTIDGMNIVTAIKAFDPDTNEEVNFDEESETLILEQLEGII